MGRKLDGIGKLTFAIAVALFIVGYLALKSAFGADKYQTFPLNTPVVERVLVCLQLGPAVELINLGIAKDEEGIRKWADKVEGVCGPVTATIVYRKRVYLQTVDDVPFTVYEATIASVTVYIPMAGFRHDHPV